jgi:hypothetical protein
MGIACSTYGEKMNALRIWVESQKEEDHLEDQDLSWRIILKWMLERERDIGWCGMGWSNVAQDRDRWRTIVNTVMNLRVP